MAELRRQPSPVPGIPPLFGRDREVATLAEALFTEAAGSGALILIGRCYDLSETPPYGPWIEAFSRVWHGAALPTSPDLAGDSAQNQVVRFAAVCDYLGTLATRQPLVLLLDDLHWADLASLDPWLTSSPICRCSCLPPTAMTR